MKKYKLRSQLVTATFEGIVEANSEEEAIEKFQSNDVIGIDEFPERLEINIECEEIENA